MAPRGGGPTLVCIVLLLHQTTATDAERAVRLKSTSRLKQMLMDLDIEVPKSASKELLHKLALQHDVIGRHAQLQMKPTARARADDNSAIGVGGPCKSFCKGSCCYFSQPWTTCSGCDKSWTCNPTAECYSTGTGNAPGDVGPASERCSPMCMASSCRDFSTPEKECAGCDARNACHPGSRHYRVGMGVRDEL